MKLVPEREEDIQAENRFANQENPDFFDFPSFGDYSESKGVGESESIAG